MNDNNGNSNLSVGEMRDILVNNFGYGRAKAEDIKGKANLREILTEEMRAKGLSNDLDKAYGESEDEDEGDSNDVDDEYNFHDYERGSKEWQDYVIAQFTEEELDKGYPKLNGLRRVCRKVLGTVVSSEITELKAFNENHSICRYALEVRSFQDGLIRVEAVADATPQNMDDTYKIYPSCIAENRAEARAYRKALMLSVVAAEEMRENKSEFQSVLTAGEYNENEPMTPQQKLVLEKKADDLGVDLEGFYQYMSFDKGNANKKEALELIKVITSYNDKSKIPEEILR